MELTDFQKKLVTLLPKIEFAMEEPMEKHTSFRIGGPVEVMAFPKNAEELASLLKTSHLLHITPAILGAGTNILAPDEGIRGLVICLKDCMDGMFNVQPGYSGGAFYCGAQSFQNGNHILFLCYIQNIRKIVFFILKVSSPRDNIVSIWHIL